MSWLELFEEGLALNEVGDISPYVLSDAGTPRSRLSFGKSQFDVGQRPDAFRKVGFTSSEIAVLKGIRLRSASAGQKSFVAKANQKLQAAKDIVDQLDEEQAKILIEEVKLTLSDFKGQITPSAFAQLVDIMNQYGAPPPARYKISDAKGNITQEKIHSWRLKSLYGRTYPKDAKRRHENIEKVFKGVPPVLMTKEAIFEGFG